MYILLSMVKGIFVSKLFAINIHILIAENFMLWKLYIYVKLHVWWLMIIFFFSHRM